MEKKLSFNEDAAGYDKWRPSYSPEIFNEIISYSNISSQSKVIEIGCGTGQATKPFLDMGCNLTAVEIGANLADMVKEKFHEYNNFTVVNTSFEDFSMEEESADLIFSGTAFHWIPEELGYPKIKDLLKKGGTAALFWTRAAAHNPNSPMNTAIQEIYRQCNFPKSSYEDDIETHIKRNTDALKHYGFTNITYHIYERFRTYSAEEYMSVINTYSNHKTLPQDIKEKLFTGIKAAVETYGGHYTIHDIMDLYLAGRP